MCVSCTYEKSPEKTVPFDLTVQLDAALFNFWFNFVLPLSLHYYVPLYLRRSPPLIAPITECSQEDQVEINAPDTCGAMSEGSGKSMRNIISNGTDTRLYPYPTGL